MVLIKGNDRLEIEEDTSDSDVIGSSDEEMESGDEFDDDVEEGGESMDDDGSDGDDGGSEDSSSGEDEKKKVDLVDVPGRAVGLPNPPRAKKVNKRKEKKKRTRREEADKRDAKKARDMFGLVKPDVVADREKERLLRRIATKGVVQLFNAVADRQKFLQEEIQKKQSSKERASNIMAAQFQIGDKAVDATPVLKKEELDVKEEEEYND